MVTHPFPSCARVAPSPSCLATSAPAPEQARSGCARTTVPCGSPVRCSSSRTASRRPAPGAGIPPAGCLAVPTRSGPPNNLTGKREPAFNGTPQGLRIGDSLAEARMLYPGHVTARAENGGVYAITTATGTVRGYLSLEVSNPPDKIKIVSISAGSVGCPAASPG